MKAYIRTLVIGVGCLLASCNNYLDINTNPNQAISSTPALLLASSLAGTANLLENYNAYGMQTGGYGANAGGYGGFNEFVTYAYTNSTGANLWTNTYYNLENYQQIINLSKSSASNVYYYAMATIMRAHDFQLLVDEYGDVPYLGALSGINNLTPSYDKGSDIYPLLAVELDSAIARINRGKAATIAPIAPSSDDILFAGNMTSWIQLANTLKLKLLVRGKGLATFSNTSFDAAGFLTADAQINPGYKNDNGRQNPKWANWAWNYSGSPVNKAWMPSTWILSFYDGTKLSDAGRGAVTYYNFASGTSKITNQLGYEDVSVPSCPDGTFWYSGATRTPSAAGAAPGAMKGPDAPYPLFTAAEAYFLQAEAALVGITIPGSPSDATTFNAGLVASFTYLYTLPNGALVTGKVPATDKAAYVAANTGKYLADYSAATTTAQKLEAIITQKYIALNFIHSHEGWNEYRRTGYPTVTGNTAKTTFASIKSQSTRADKLPTRLLYPVSEARYNPSNVPQGVSPFTSLIFWAK